MLQMLQMVLTNDYLPCGCVFCVFVLDVFLSPTKIESRPSFLLFHLHLYIHTPQIAGYLYKNIQRLDHRVSLFTEYNAFYNIILNFRSCISMPLELKRKFTHHCQNIFLRIPPSLAWGPSKRRIITQNR